MAGRGKQWQFMLKASWDEQERLLGLPKQYVFNQLEMLLTSSITRCITLLSAIQDWTWRRSTPVVQNNSLVEGQILETSHTIYPKEPRPGKDLPLSNATRDATPTAAKQQGWAMIVLVPYGKFSSMN